MALGRAADQLIGNELQNALFASASVAVGTWHLGLGSPTPASPPSYIMKAGAPAIPDALTAAGKFLHFVIDITNVGGAGTATVTLVGMDPNSGKIYTLLVSTALAAVATTVLKIGPGLTPVANLTVNDFVPISWGVQVVIATNAVVLSLSALQMP